MMHLLCLIKVMLSINFFCLFLSTQGLRGGCRRQKHIFGAVERQQIHVYSNMVIRCSNQKGSNSKMMKNPTSHIILVLQSDLFNHQFKVTENPKKGQMGHFEEPGISYPYLKLLGVRHRNRRWVITTLHILESSYS